MPAKLPPPSAAGEVDRVASEQGDASESTPELNSARIPLPRSQRQPRRQKADRGLPTDEELVKLAKVFLERQRKLWPKLATLALFPEPTPEVLTQMVADFKQRHRSGKVDADALSPFTKLAVKLAGSYNRYSCENSSPTSVLDQLVNSLNKAQAEERLIPWQYVFADYSVTGLDASRQGYASYKSVLEDPEQWIETTYIDDFTRASRDAIEWWKLAARSKRLNKRMIGASDGFDLGSVDWDIKITIYGLLSRLFIKGLREKVKRGMSGAARRGTCLGKFGLGFARRIHCDEHGRPVTDAQGQPIYERCIDPVTRDDRRLAFDLFVEQNWSPYKITREFNRRKVDGSDNWTEAAIKKQLWGPDAIGVFIWNKTRREYDLDADKWLVLPNPHKEWVVRYDPTMALVPIPQWRAARRKLAAMRRASPRTGKQQSRNQVSATTLFSGTLFCAYCQAELKLNRSTKQHKQTACLHGLAGARGCRLSTSKSTDIIEKSLLSWLRSNILTDVLLEALVRRANEHLAIEAQRPLVDTRPWKVDLRKQQAKIKKLVLLVENEADRELCIAYNDRVKELQREVIALQAKIREAEGAVRKQVKPLTLEKAREYLDRLRETLGGDIPVAAEALRTITGPIRVRQEAILGRKTGARWIATFRPNLLKAIDWLANGKPTPSDVKADQHPVVEIALEKVPKYELLAPRFKQLRASGASVESIASAHGMCRAYAEQILKFAETGERPQWKSGKRTGTGNRVEYIENSPQVVEMRDVQKLSFARIAASLGIGEGTVRRAYDYGHPELVREAVESGKTPKRGTYSHLGAEVHQQIRALLQAGTKPAEIVRQIGCGKSTVYRVKQQLDRPHGDHDAA